MQDLGLSSSTTSTNAAGTTAPGRDIARPVRRSVAYVDNGGPDATGQTITVQRLISDPSERQFLLTNPAEHVHTCQRLHLPAHQAHVQPLAAHGRAHLWTAEGRLASSLAASQRPAQQRAHRFGQNPNDFVNTDGQLIGDRPWTFRTQLVYELPAGFLVGANYTYQSGRPWARTARVRASGSATTILAEPIDGSRRVPSWNLLDLRLQKSFKLGGERRLGRCSPTCSTRSTTTPTRACSTAAGPPTTSPFRRASCCRGA